jgi:hypothetical protein
MQIVAGMALLATCCSAWLYLRTREFYYTTTFAAVHQHDHDMERAHSLLPEGDEAPPRQQG